jgi:hypothetical protein
MVNSIRLPYQLRSKRLMTCRSLVHGTMQHHIQVVFAVSLVRSGEKNTIGSNQALKILII